MKISINEELLGFKLEAMMLKGKAKLSQLFVVCGAPEEADFEKVLPDSFIDNLKLNLAEKNTELLQLVDTNKIKVFFSKKCIKWNKDIPMYAQWILDSRKFEYPNVSIPKSVRVN